MARRSSFSVGVLSRVLAVVMLVLAVLGSTSLVTATRIAAPESRPYEFAAGLHMDITVQALQATKRTVNGKLLEFYPQAISDIQFANTYTDSPLSATAYDRAAHFLNEQFGPATQRLIDRKNDVINYLTASPPDGASARKQLGTALHTLQDFYAHSNWDHMGNHTIYPDLGTVSFDTSVSDPCPNDPAVLDGNGLTSLTSAYISFADPWWAPPGSCRHGWLGMTPGIAIDSDSHPMYPEARRLAIEDSINFLNLVLNAPGVEGNEGAIGALMGVKGTLGMVIDDTGSMGDDIQQVQAEVTKIVRDAVGPFGGPDQYLLVRFGDPDVGSPYVTSDPDAYLAAVNALYAQGGGDCPEFSQQALLNAIGASRNDSSLFLFTDASAKDSSMVGNVVAAAQAKRIKITPLLTGSCSPIDQAYIRNATETGGQLFVLSQSELSQAFNLIKPQLTGDFVSILSARGTLAGDSREFDVPIDSTVANVVFSVSISDATEIVVRRPSGAVVTPGESGVQISDLSSGSIVAVAAPEPGVWKVQVAGSGEYSVAVKGNSPIELRRFEFVQLDNRPDRTFFPIPGQPLVGTSQTGLATVLGGVASADFKLVGENGDVIQPVSLLPGNIHIGAGQFVGEFGLPAQPFRVSVNGLDGNGQPYQRLFSTLFRAQTVEVVANTTIRSLQVGVTTPISFTVRNLGGSGTFQISVVDNRGFVSQVQPGTLTLATGASGVVWANVTVPTGTPDNAEVLISATATNTSDVGITNSATLQMVAIGNRPPDCSAAVPSAPRIWPPNNKFVPVTVSGISDPDGDTVSTTVTSIRQDETVGSAADGNGVGASAAKVRAERDGAGDGRVYHIAFSAGDEHGAVCTGAVVVGVPHDESGSDPVDGGPLYDSTLPAP